MKLFSFMIAPEDLDYIREYCHNRGASVSALIRGLIQDYITQLKEQSHE